MTFGIETTALSTKCDKNLDYGTVINYYLTMKYDSVEKQFHKLPKEQFDEWFDKRINSNTAYRLNFKVGDYPAFFCFDIPLFNKLLEIQQKNDKLNFLFNSLPLIASKQYIRNSLVVDVKTTNEIEGVFSSRKEIFELTEDLKKRKSNKIGSIVNKYLMLLNGKSERNIAKCEDIRKIYDELFMYGDESLIDPDKWPDGKLFRKDFVGVFDAGCSEPIHKGIVPEEKIIEYLNTSLSILNNQNINVFVRLSLFHYIFEYVHPFYDGNGRIGRYLLSMIIKDKISSIFAFRISAGIKNYKSKYYKAFKDTESVLNRGDLTLFVYEFLEILDKTYENCIDYADSKRKELEESYIKLKDKFSHLSKNEESILYVLTQATIFSDFGITIQEIQKTLKISVRTIRRCISLFKAKSILNEKRYSKKLFYTLVY